MNPKNGKNMERFATMMANRMKETSAAAVPTTIELATVSDGLAIIPDSLGEPIPKEDYMVNIMLTGTAYTGYANVQLTGGSHGGHEDGGDGSHSHAGGNHRHSMPSYIRGLEPGDRVLIAWAGGEPVVLAIVS